ncbi:MAG TPA: HAMP domain-containing sensor histidine kinase [Micromonosporaceae bacterium]
MRSRLLALGLRGRLGLAAGAAVALVVGLVTALGYVIVRHDLVGDMDGELRAAYTLSRQAAVRGDPPWFAETITQPPAEVQYVAPDGTVTTSAGERLLPVTARTLAVADGRDDASFLSDADVAGTHLRLLTVAWPDGGAVQIALPMTDLDARLSRLAARLAWVGLLGLVLAAALTWLVGRAVLSPVSRLTDAAERVSSTMDLTHRIDTAGPDELHRLAVSFNAMLDAVAAAVDAQRQLVADASHELRTPLTSLRTNVELLARAEGMAPADRSRLVARIDAGLADLSGLVGDIIDLARGEEAAELVSDVRLDAVTRDVAERAARHWSTVSFTTTVEPVLIRGVADRIFRAVTNLVDNAAKFSPAGGEVEVEVRMVDGGGQVRVRDHGPGVAESDLPRVFDRFYRSPNARNVPGAGLGLAIVGQVARSHDGWARLERAPDGGTVAVLWLPLSSL